jgi:hypothetical protein
VSGWIVEVGLAIGATVPTTTFIIGSASQGIIGTNLIGTANMLADLSDRKQEITVSRTSDRTAGPLITYNAGTATVKLLNMDGALDPYVLEAAGLTGPGVILRLRYMLPSGTIQPVFYGFIDSWDPDATSPLVGIVTITATDGFILLNQATDELVAPVGANETVTARVARVLDAMGWSAVLRSLGTTSEIVQATSFGSPGLELIQDAVKAEIGEFYMQPDGVAFLRGRHAIQTDTRSATSQATFGSDRAGGEIPYVGRPLTAWDKTQMHNRVKATIDGSTNVQIAQDPTSIGLYGTAYTVEESALKLTADSEALSWANYVLAADVKPTFRFSGITLNSALEQLGVPTLDQQFGRIMGDRVTVVRRPPAQPYGSIVDTRDLYVQGISHAWNAKSKQTLTTFDLQPVSKLPFFVIGSATQGVIGQSVIAW